MFNLSQKAYLLFALTKRDYAIQYAGSILGIIWMVFQSLFFLGLYVFISIVLNLNQFYNQSKDFSLLLSGVVFWIPLQEYILRTSNILVENRNLLKKTTISPYYILLIPSLQMSFHYILLCIPFGLILYFLGVLNLYFYVFGVGFLILSAFFLFPILVYLANSNILLKDISPILRIFLQLVFWSLPILYSPNSKFSVVLSWNPLFSSLEIFRYFILANYSPKINWVSICVLIFVSSFFWFFANLRIQKIVLDHI